MMGSKTLTTQEAWKKAAYYLTMCCGFPKDAKRKLFKAEQTYCQRTNQHKIAFTLLINHPVVVPTNKVLAEKSVEPVWAYYANPEKIDEKPFKILRDLIDILETNYEAMNIEKKATQSIASARDKNTSD